MEISKWMIERGRFSFTDEKSWLNRSWYKVTGRNSTNARYHSIQAGWWIIRALGTRQHALHEVVVTVPKVCNWFWTAWLQSAWQIKITASAVRDNRVIMSLGCCNPTLMRGMAHRSLQSTTLLPGLYYVAPQSCRTLKFYNGDQSHADLF